jgi:hypothetical protein
VYFIIQAPVHIVLTKERIEAKLPARGASALRTSWDKDTPCGSPTPRRELLGTLQNVLVDIQSGSHHLIITHQSSGVNKHTNDGRAYEALREGGIHPQDPSATSQCEKLERAARIELATSSLGSWHSTAELHPLCTPSLKSIDLVVKYFPPRIAICRQRVAMRRLHRRRQSRKSCVDGFASRRYRALPAAGKFWLLARDDLVREPRRIRSRRVGLGGMRASSAGPSVHA